MVYYYGYLTNALMDVNMERARQDSKWGVQNHSLVEWTTILAEEFGEASKEINEFHFRDGDRSKIREELLQTAAVAVAMVEYLDRHGTLELKLREHGAQK